MHFHNLFGVNCSDTENSRTEIFTRLIFSSSEVFFSFFFFFFLSLENKEGAERDNLLLFQIFAYSGRYV